MHLLLDPVLEPEAGDTWKLVDAGDGAPPSLGHPLLASLVERTGACHGPRWGGPTWHRSGTRRPRRQLRPGDPLLAHHPDERVTRHQLERARDVLVGLVSSTP